MKMKKMGWMLLTMMLCAILMALSCATSGGAAASYNPGTYTATAMGFGGNITVTIEVDSRKIISVRAEGPDETQGIGDLALDELPKRIQRANSVAVDSVSGATLTSEGILEAAAAALEKAK